MDQILLQRAPGAFQGRHCRSSCVFAAHRRLPIEVTQYLPVFMGAILAAPVRVMDQPAGGALGGHGSKQGLADQVPRQAFSHGTLSQSRKCGKMKRKWQVN
jgi:hypothetical protein